MSNSVKDTLKWRSEHHDEYLAYMKEYNKAYSAKKLAKTGYKGGYKGDFEVISDPTTFEGLPAGLLPGRLLTSTEIRQMLSNHYLDNGAKFKDDHGNIYLIEKFKLVLQEGQK